MISNRLKMHKSIHQVNSKIETTDDSLITRLQNGDKQAFKLLFDKYGNRMYQFSLKYLREKEDAEDLLNEVFLKIWENRLSIKTNTSFQAYLFTIAYNNIRKRFLKKGREEHYIQLFAEEYLYESSMIDEKLDYISFQNKLNHIITLLPLRRQEVFILHYKDELKNAEIAFRLEVSEQFVKNQLTIARKFIIDKMKEENQLAGILLFYLFTKTELN